ncbi:MAG: hypothetical protein K6G88_01860 [Lachnospiraceae bacterium]|nr:hypothetical protein [Lachnospiraceae bacterium]
MEKRIKRIVAFIIAFALMVTGINFSGIGSKTVDADSQGEVTITAITYEGVTDNTVSGADVVLYYKESANAQEVVWNNSQLQPTDETGSVSWTGPKGYWRVKASKENYEDTYSEWYDVTSATDIYVKMENADLAQITYAKAHQTYFDVEFSQYLDPTTFSNITIRTMTSGYIFFDAIYDDTQTDHNGNVYAKKIRFEYTYGRPEVGSYITLVINSMIKDCLGRMVERYSWEERVLIDGNSSDIEISEGVEMLGFQVSAYVEGMRANYLVDNVIDGKQVVERGLVYGLATYCSQKDVYVGSPDWFVRSFSATSKGNIPLSDLDRQEIGISESTDMYAMTMLFTQHKNALEFNDDMIVRAYALLEDGNYYYSNEIQYNIYDIANLFYANSYSFDEYSHNYLFNTILKVVKPDYIPIAYEPLEY